MDYTGIILTLLTIATGLLGILTFINGRKKDNISDGEKDGALRADLAYIKSVLLDVRSETKEINKLLEDHSQRLARCEERIKSIFARIEQIEKRCKKAEDERED